MTREEAIDILTHGFGTWGRANGKTRFGEAIKRAIEALKQTDRDTISRQATIDAMINSRSNADVTLVPGSYTNGWRDGRKLLLDELLQVVFELPSAQPESTRTFVELVVRYPDPELCTYKEYKGKPYYSIKYIENGETYVGYGTYNPEVLSQYLKEYFISSAQPDLCDGCDRYGASCVGEGCGKLEMPEIIRCKDCKHWREGITYSYCDKLYGMGVLDIYDYMTSEDDFCSKAERKTDGVDS